MPALDPSREYRNVIFSSATIDVLVKGNIISANGSVQLLLDKLSERLLSAEELLGGNAAEARAVVSRLIEFIEKGICVLGSPLLTNVSSDNPTLASCTAVPMGIGPLNGSLFSLAEDYYKLNMGSGYNLDHFPDPVGALRALNQHAHNLETSGFCERYIGNIAHVSVHHPRILEFIHAKMDHAGIVHFNTSIDVSDVFMDAAHSGQVYALADGSTKQAKDIWDSIVQCAWLCGDPGIISLDRFNRQNPVAAISPYVTTAPCAEVGLASGESCVFAYINLAGCLKSNGQGLYLDYELIGDVAECLTRVLDDALEFSLAGFPTAISTSIMQSNRKIGIGVCGYADLLLWLGLDYASDEGCELLKRAVTTLGDIPIKGIPIFGEQ